MIVISPKWRGPSLDTTPATVHTLSAQQLQRDQVDDLQQLQRQVPGLVFPSSGGIGQATLRGVGSTLSAAGDSGVSLFSDGIYRNSTASVVRGLYDVEQVEIIKGPQGVQLGRNVLGGAITVMTRDPQPYRSGYADFTYGSFNQREFRGALNMPLSLPGLSLRLAGYTAKRGGYARNTLLDQDLDNKDYASWRTKLRFQPDTDLDIVLTGQFSQENDSAGIAPQPDPDFGINAGILYGGKVSSDPRKLTYNTPQTKNGRDRLYGLRITRNSPGLEFQSTTGYQHTLLDNSEDLDGTNVDFASVFSRLATHSVSQEFRLRSKPRRKIEWSAGLYLMQGDTNQHSDLVLPMTDLTIATSSDNSRSANAFFGSIKVALLESVDLEAGLRHTRETRSIDMTQVVDDPLGVVGTPGHTTTVQKAKGRWNSTTPELTLSYAPTKNDYYYAKASRGFKSGGFNAYTIQPSFEPERLSAYEIGLKTHIPKTRLNLNAAAFYYDYTDLQLFTLPPGAPTGTIPIITNAAKASVRGLDLELIYRPLSKLTLRAAATFLDACFEKFLSVDPNNPSANPDRAGKTLPYAPKASLVFGGTYRWSLDSGTLELSSNYRYQSSVYFNPYQDNAVRQSGYGLLDGGLRFTSRDGSWHAALQGENLTGQVYALNKIRIDPIVGTTRYWGPPRTLTLSAGMRF